MHFLGGSPNVAMAETSASQSWLFLPEHSTEEGVVVGFLSALCASNSKHKGYPPVICCGDEFSEVSIKLSSFRLQAFSRSWRKGAMRQPESQQASGQPGSSLGDTRSGGREIGNISLEN